MSYSHSKKPLLLFNRVERRMDISQMRFTSRMLALLQFVERHGGRVIEVQNDNWRRSKVARAIRPWTLVREVAAAKPDVVITQYPNYPFFWSLDRPRDLRRSMVFSHLIRRYCNRTGARLVLDYRDWIDASQLSVPARLFERFERVVFTYPDAIWFVSEGCRSKAAEKHDLSRIFLQVAPNGAFAPDFTRICIQERSSLVRFLYAGDLGQQGRGIEELIAAIDACADLPCEFVLCGHNGEWLEQRETAPNVTFLGELSRSEVIRLMPSCDVGLIPLPDSDYYHRSFPTKLGEYVHNGLAILCTPVRDTADFVNAHNLGLAVPFHEWPKAIKRFVQDADLLERCKANSRALAPEMTWDRIYDRAFEELVSHFWGTNED